MDKPESVTGELNRMAGAIFLTQSKFRTAYYLTDSMLNPDSNIDYEGLAKREMTSNLTRKILESFEKEVKKTVYHNGEELSLELYIFPPTALKLALEYMVSEMPQSELDRIRQKSYEPIR
jgi:hypothetical protein